MLSGQRLWSGLVLAMGASLSLIGSSAIAQSEEGFRQYLNEFAAQARAGGVEQPTLDRVLPTLSLNSRVIELDQSQPGSSDPGAPIPDFAPYRNRHVVASRINKGRDVYSQLLPQLQRIEERTGVPAQFLIAIYGKESNYGSYTGNFDTMSSLATLAYEGRRRELFSGELVAALKMVQRGVARDQLTGSWAGAMGKPQFLPSVYLRLAADGDGDGFADIWGSEADAMASIANYFVQSGWRRDVPWGFAVSVPSSLNREAIRNETVAQRCPRVMERHSKWKTMAEWRDLGVVPMNRSWPGDNVLATLLEPDGQGRTAYLLTSNYRVILDYNCSNFYALSVGLIADEIRR